MKIKIHYRKEVSLSGWPYWAETVFQGQSLLACGESYKLAKERLLAMILNHRANPPVVGIPADEEVEV